MEVLAVRPVKQDEQTYKRWFDYADTGVYFFFPSLSFPFSCFDHASCEHCPCFLVFWVCGFSVFCASCRACSGFKITS